MLKKYKRLLLFLLLVLLLLFLYQTGSATFLNFHYLKNHLQEIQNQIKDHPVEGVLIYFFIYTILTGLSVPGATVLTLLAGALFGLWIGAIIVALASTLGATMAMLLSRFLFRETVKKKFHKQLQQINKNIEKEGAIYLLTLRLIPIFPFFVINLVLGVTNINVLTYTMVSFFGMIPAILAYVYAGLEFSRLTSLSQIISTRIILILVFLGILPSLFKFVINKIRHFQLYKKFQRPKKFDYNLIVIGSGAGGLSAAYLGSSLKAKVALIEKGEMGGDCLNHGCVPSKTLIKSARTIYLAKRAQELGLDKIEVQFNFSELMQRVRQTIEVIAPHDSMERYRALGVDCFKGRAKILSPFIVSVQDQKFSTENIIIATGARPIVPSIPGLESVSYLTSETLWNLQELPARLLILGGGPIGCEMAQCFRRLGSEVIIVDHNERLLKKEDPDIARRIENIFLNEGIQLALSYRALSFGSDHGECFLECETKESKKRFYFDKVLLAVGRTAEVTDLWSEELGISQRENHTISTNDFLETNYPNIFACGDVSGPYQLTHMSSHQAAYSVLNSLFGKFKKSKVDYSVVSWCTFTDPEVATVGQNELSASTAGLEFEVTLYELGDLDRALTDSENSGLVKVITQKGSDRILGATIISTYASTMILEFICAMKYKKGMKSILGTIHPYPTFGEANKYAAGLWQKNHAPLRLMNWLERYFLWRRG